MIRIGLMQKLVAARLVRRLQASLAPTVVLPVPLAPAIEEISPYLKPPPRTCSSSPAQPELAGDGTRLRCSLAADRRVDARRPGAGWAPSIAYHAKASLHGKAGSEVFKKLESENTI